MRLAGTVTDPHGLGRHDHACWFYGSTEEFAAAARRFLLDGLHLGERLLCVGEIAIRSATEGASALPGAADLVRSGRLDLVPVPAVTAAYGGAVEQALADGYTGLRVAAESTDLVRDPRRWAEHLRWEQLTDRCVAADPGMAALCGYRADAVDEWRQAGLAAFHPLSGGAAGPEVLFRLFFERDVLCLSGDVDGFCAGQLGELLRAAEVAGRRVDLDVSRVGFIDGAGACVLAAWGRELAAAGGQLRLRGARRQLRRVWSVLDLGGAATLTD